LKNHIVGKLEKEILEQLGMKRDQLIQHIKKSVKASRGKRVDYSNVHDSVKNLEKKGYIEKGELVKSLKGAEHPGYRLTEQGLTYLMKKSDNVDFQKVFNNYDDELHFAETWKEWTKKFPEYFLKRVLKVTGACYLLVLKKEKHKDWPSFFASASLTAITQMPPKERKEMFKIINRDRRLSRDLNRVIHDLRRTDS